MVWPKRSESERERDGEGLENAASAGGGVPAWAPDGARWIFRVPDTFGGYAFIFVEIEGDLVCRVSAVYEYCL